MRGDAGSGQSETTSKRSRKAPKRTASYKSSISRTIASSPGKETQVIKATRRPRRESLKGKGRVVVKTTSTSKRKNITETEDSLPTIQIKRRKLSTKGLSKGDVSTKRVVHNTRLQRRKVLAKAAEDLLLDGAVNHSSTQTIPTVHVYNKKYKQSEFNPGLVISTPWHEPDFDPANALKMEPRRVETVLGPVYSKPRKLIVLSTFEDHCLTVPIFSFNENGLKYKSNKGDFVRIEDKLIKDHPPPSENGYAPLTFSRAKEYRHFNNGFHVMSPSSYAHITFPVSFRYVHPCIIEGKITQESLRDLIDLYNARAPVLSTARKRGNFARRSRATQN